MACKKRQFLGLLHRESVWNLDPNGRSTDFLPSNMMGYGYRFNCSYCYVDRSDPATFTKLYDDALDIVGLIKRTMLNLQKSEDLFYKVTKKNKSKENEILSIVIILLLIWDLIQIAFLTIKLQAVK